MSSRMQPPSQQPLGFWTVKAGEAIRARTRSELSGIGVTQSEWWTLQQLNLHPDGMAESELVAIIGSNESDEAIREALAGAAAKGWIVRRSEALVLSASGTERFDAAAAVQRRLADERMQGIDERDLTTTIEVLQRTIRNVGGDAWHW